MRKRFPFTLLIWIGLLSAPLSAQELTPVGEFNVGYSLLSPDFDVTGHGITLGIIGNATTWFGMEGQVDAWFNIGHSSLDIYTTVGGPRVAFRMDSITPFVHVLAGGAYFHLGGRTNTRFAMKYGGGIDVNFGESYAWRIEVNDLMLVDPVDHNFNLSTGFVLRWQ